MPEIMTDEERKIARSFYRNYQAVIRTIRDLAKGASETELVKLEDYKKRLEELILAMAQHVKNSYNRKAYSHEENYQPVKKFLSETADAIQIRMLYHNALILKANEADLICQALNCQPLFGDFGDYSSNIDLLMQASYEGSDDMPLEARDKRLEVFRWACSIALLALTGDRVKNHTDFIDDPTDSLEANDFIEHSSESEIEDALKAMAGR